MPGDEPGGQSKRGLGGGAVVGIRGVLGFSGEAEDLGVEVGIFLVRGCRGDLGGTGGTGVDEVVMTEGCGIKVRKIAFRGSWGCNE